MSKFFESEVVQEELKIINRMQEEIYSTMLSFGSMEHEDQIEHIEKLTVLLDKQRVMYTRLSLSDDPQALGMKKHLEKSVQLMGFPEGTDMNMIFSGMTKTIEKLKQVVDQ